MKMKALGIVVVVLLGVFFGLMFNAVDQNVVLTRQLLVRQGEILDLMRSVVNENKETKTTVADLGKKFDDVFKMVKQGPAPVPNQPEPSREDFNKVYEIPIGDSAVQGKAAAPITIVGFLDVQCPFSKRFQPVIDQVLEAYPGKVKYVVKNFPLGFHQQAIPAAKALLAAGKQGKYAEMLAGVLENNNQLSDAKYEEIAKSIGLNIKRFKKDLQDNDAAWDKLIQDDLNLGMQVDVRGTPTYYLNGKKTMARSLEAFKAEIDKILGEKK